MKKQIVAPQTPVSKRRRLIESLFAGDDDLRRLVRELNLDARSLAELSDHEVVARSLDALRQIAMAHNEFVLYRYRGLALTTLARLALQREDAELARRAAADLLKVPLPGGGSQRKVSVTYEEPTTVDIEQVRQMLSKIGEGEG